MKLLNAIFLFIAIAVILVACDREPGSSTSSSTPAGSSDQTSSANLINAAIPKDAISTELKLAGHPSYSANDDTLHVHIRVFNRGKADLISAGTAMVRLGAMLIGPNGPDQAPGKRDFARIDLPMIAPGNAIDVEARLPASTLLGLPIRFDLVQEGVNWFSVYGQPTLDVGPFKRCNDDPKSLCDADNHSVPGQ